MSFRLFVAAFAAFSFASVASAATLDVSCAREANTVSDQQSELATLFDAPTDDLVVAQDGMMVIAAPVHMVMLARRGDDGMLVTTCVTSTEAAEAFLRPRNRTADSQKAQEK